MLSSKQKIVLGLMLPLMLPIFASARQVVGGGAEARLEKISKKLLQERQQQQTLELQENSVLKILADVDNTIREKKKQYSLLNQQTAEKSSSLNSLNRKVSRLETEIKQHRTLLLGRLRAMYMEDRSGGINTVLDGMLDMDNIYNSLRGYEYLRIVSKKDTENILLFKQKIALLKNYKNNLNLANKDLASTQNKLYKEIELIKKETDKKRRLVDSINKKKILLETAILELEATAEKVRFVIKNAAAGTTDISAPHFNGLTKGKLIWPSLGMIVSVFGKQKHKKFDTYIYKKGIEISSFDGDPVKATGAGRVIFSDRFQGYGLLVIIDHGKKYYSLYAHLSSSALKKGDIVASGDRVGDIGGSGLSDGNRLYFELRHESNAVNPIDWLRKKDKHLIMNQEDKND